MGFRWPFLSYGGRSQLATSLELPSVFLCVTVQGVTSRIMAVAPSIRKGKAQGYRTSIEMCPTRAGGHIYAQTREGIEHSTVFSVLRPPCG
jgi:hypothetical protein